MSVECLELRGVKGEFLKGVAKIKLNDLGIILSDVKLFKKNEKYWVSLPDKEYNSNGEKKYYKLVQFIDKEKGDTINKLIVECLVKNFELGNETHLQNRKDTQYSFDGF